MKVPRPQFRVRGLLLATFWLAVCVSCYVTITRLHRVRVSSPYEVPLTHVMMLAPFLAVAALFGRTWLGALVGVVSLGLFWMFFMRCERGNEESRQ